MTTFLERLEEVQASRIQDGILTQSKIWQDLREYFGKTEKIVEIQEEILERLKKRPFNPIEESKSISVEIYCVNRADRMNEKYPMFSDHLKKIISVHSGEIITLLGLPPETRLTITRDAYNEVNTIYAKIQIPKKEETK